MARRMHSETMHTGLLPGPLYHSITSAHVIPTDIRRLCSHHARYIRTTIGAREPFWSSLRAGINSLVHHRTSRPPETWEASSCREATRRNVRLPAYSRPSFCSSAIRQGPVPRYRTRHTAPLPSLFFDAAHEAPGRPSCSASARSPSRTSPTAYACPENITRTGRAPPAYARPENVTRTGRAPPPTTATRIAATPVASYHLYPYHKRLSNI